MKTREQIEFEHERLKRLYARKLASYQAGVRANDEPEYVNLGFWDCEITRAEANAHAWTLGVDLIPETPNLKRTSPVP